MCYLTYDKISCEFKNYMAESPLIQPLPNLQKNSNNHIFWHQDN